MTKLVIATVAVAMTIAAINQAAATEWWVLTRPEFEASTYDRGSFTICQRGLQTPAEVFERERDQGHFPEIQEAGDGVKVRWFNDLQKRPRVVTFIYFFKNEESCEKQAQANRSESDKLNKYR
jgi:hypothetical protein